MKKKIITMVAATALSVASAFLGINLSEPQVECVSQVVGELAAGE